MARLIEAVHEFIVSLICWVLIPTHEDDAMRLLFFPSWSPIGGLFFSLFNGGRANGWLVSSALQYVLLLAVEVELSRP